MSQRDPRRRTYCVIVHSVCVPVPSISSVSAVEPPSDVIRAVQLPSGELLRRVHQWWNNKCECEYRWEASASLSRSRRRRRGVRVHTDKAATPRAGAFNSFCGPQSILIRYNDQRCILAARTVPRPSQLSQPLPTFKQQIFTSKVIRPLLTV